MKGKQILFFVFSLFYTLAVRNVKIDSFSNQFIQSGNNIKSASLSENSAYLSEAVIVKPFYTNSSSVKRIVTEVFSDVSFSFFKKFEQTIFFYIKKAAQQPRLVQDKYKKSIILIQTVL